MIRGYVLVEAEVGHTQAVGNSLQHAQPSTARIMTVDTVTGPYDVVVQLEADDIDQLGKAVTECIQQVPGVQRTTTCLSMALGVPSRNGKRGMYR